MLIHAALALSLLESLALAAVLLLWADRVAGARLLVLFLCGVSVWIVGNELPTWFGPGAQYAGLALLALAPLASAVFLHFASVFCGARLPRAVLGGAYALAGAASLLALLLPPGAYVPFAGLRYVAVPSPVGWVATAAWGGLAAAGHLVLLRAWAQRRGLARAQEERRQVAAVAASSAWGLLCMSGYGIAALDLPLYPWPLALLPAYPIILVYGILRYRVFVANAWARRALVWSLLAGLAVLVVALVPLLPLPGGIAAPWASGALVALCFIGLAGPARNLAERLIYPGGVVTAADMAHWRAALAELDSWADLAAQSSALLSRRLAIQVGVAVGEAEAGSALPRLLCQRGPGGRWATRTVGWDAAPPGPRHVAELFGTVLADAAARLERAAVLAERERERQTQARLAELGAIAATVAHDVRNPLNIISMAAASAPADVQAEIGEQVGRVARLAQDLLDYAKPWRIEPRAYDLAAQVRILARRYPGMTVGDGLAGELPVLADPRRMEQALVNLLDNAARARPGARVLVDADTDPVTAAGDPVTVPDHAATAPSHTLATAGHPGAALGDAGAAPAQSLAVAPGPLRLHVCDDGPGVPEDLREALFRPFVSRTPGGTGLGLAIVARIMEAHGGSAALGSRPGWRTCFTLTLPGHARQEAAPTAAAARTATSPAFQSAAE